jgi:hypothetical protein
MVSFVSEAATAGPRCDTAQREASPTEGRGTEKRGSWNKIIGGDPVARSCPPKPWRRRIERPGRRPFMPRKPAFFRSEGSCPCPRVVKCAVRFARSRHHVCSGGRTQEPNSSDENSRPVRRARCPALRAQSSRPNIRADHRNPNRRTRGVRPALGKAKDVQGSALPLPPRHRTTQSEPAAGRRSASVGIGAKADVRSTSGPSTGVGVFLTTNCS